MNVRDRVGMGWRDTLAASVLERLAEIDVVEVMAEDWLDAPRAQCAALADLARCTALMLHGVSLGLATRERVDRRRLDRLARLVERTRPEAWSEHLAFVRADGVEIGHLAAPPRTAATIEGTLANLESARRIVGRMPCVENIATLVDPPASAMDEGEWTGRIVNEARAPMLLDLHNLYANAVNFGNSPEGLLRAMPLAQVSQVHIAGGRWVRAPSGAQRLLDDHLHDVPDPVFALLETLGEIAPQPLTVILERDGRFPQFESLLAEVARARAALARGRGRRMAQAA
jgi:uncharacterized protein (UPF0276 family)